MIRAQFLLLDHFGIDKVGLQIDVYTDWHVIYISYVLTVWLQL